MAEPTISPTTAPASTISQKEGPAPARRESRAAPDAVRRWFAALPPAQKQLVLRFLDSR